MNMANMQIYIHCDNSVLICTYKYQLHILFYFLGIISQLHSPPSHELMQSFSEISGNPINIDAADL